MLSRIRSFIGRICLIVACAVILPFNPPDTTSPSAQTINCSNLTFFKDAQTGRTVARLTGSPGNEHNLGYYRDPWNADESYLALVKSDANEQNWELWLYTGDGCEIKKLWSIAQYSWMVGWHRTDPNLIYTSNGGTLYQIDVGDLTATPITSVSSGILDIFALSDTRLLLTAEAGAVTINTDGTGKRSYPALHGSVNRSFPVLRTPNKFVIANELATGTTTLAYFDVYDDSTGQLVHSFGPYDSSQWSTSISHPNFASNSMIYSRNASNEDHLGLWNPWEVHVVNIDGTNDRILFSESDPNKLKYLRNTHHNWNNNGSWFVVGLIPYAGFTYTGPWFNEELRVNLDGTTEVLGRNLTLPNAGLTGLQTFWAEDLSVVSKDGSKVLFNSNTTGDEDVYIMYVSTFPLSVSISSPSSGSLLAGSVLLTAQISGGGGGTVLQFTLDGANLGPEIASAPYSLEFDTTLVSNGTHTLGAVVRETRGSTAWASSVTVIVDNAAPLISAVTSSNICSSSATISWTTNETSDSQVNYGTSIAYGSSTVLNTSLVTPHSQVLSGLAARTLYHYRVRSKDAAGNLAVSGDFTVTTQAAADTSPPLISAVSASSITASGATITWTTNEPSTTQVEYGLTTAYGNATALNTKLATSHSQTLSGLASNTLYHYHVKSKNAAGIQAVSGDFTFKTRK